MILQRVFYSLALVGIFKVVIGGRSSTGGSKVDPSDGAVPWPGHLEPLGAKAVKKPVPVLESMFNQRCLDL